MELKILRPDRILTEAGSGHEALCEDGRAMFPKLVDPDALSPAARGRTATWIGP
jgi:hypothetical protein